MISIGGQPLPMPTLATSTDTIFADTISVRWPDAAGNDGRIDHRMLIRGLGNSREEKAFAETIRLDGDAIAFVHPPCGGPSTECFVASRTGTIRGDTLTVTFSDIGFKPTVYVRF